MSNVMQTIVIRGRFVGHEFVPNDPLPEVEGDAELVVHCQGTDDRPKPNSMFDFFGKASVLRSRDDIDRQIQEEHSSWGDR